jgi:hypothetical protein
LYAKRSLLSFRNIVLSILERRRARGEDRRESTVDARSCDRRLGDRWAL